MPCRDDLPVADNEGTDSCEHWIRAFFLLPARRNSSASHYTGKCGVIFLQPPRRRAEHRGERPDRRTETQPPGPGGVVLMDQAGWRVVRPDRRLDRTPADIRAVM